MKKVQLGSISFAMWLAVAAGCATSSPQEDSGGGAETLTPCEDPRPEMCTMHYAPVCGVLDGGDKKTYSNACTACSDHAVTGYTDGACGTGGSDDAPPE